MADRREGGSGGGAGGSSNNYRGDSSRRGNYRPRYIRHINRRTNYPNEQHQQSNGNHNSNSNTDDYDRGSHRRDRGSERNDRFDRGGRGGGGRGGRGRDQDRDRDDRQGEDRQRYRADDGNRVHKPYGRDRGGGGGGDRGRGGRGGARGGYDGGRYGSNNQGPGRRGSDDQGSSRPNIPTGPRGQQDHYNRQGPTQYRTDRAPQPQDDLAFLASRPYDPTNPMLYIPPVAASDADWRSNGKRAGDLEKMEPDEESAYIKQMMGFGDFKSTHQKYIWGNKYIGGVHKEKQIKYRQYMNREGGFNRPLSPPH